MKRVALTLTLILISSSIKAQLKMAQNWVFGQGIEMKFTKSGLVIDTNRHYAPRNGAIAYEGTLTVNDSQGNLKYYADEGYVITAANHIINPNKIQDVIGSGNSACQAFAPVCVNDSDLFIFRTSSGGGYYYVQIDKNKDTFLKPLTLLRRTISECQAIVNHNNGKWNWVVSHSLTGDTLFSYLVTENGIEECPTISHAGPDYFNYSQGQGLIKINAVGNLLCFATWDLSTIVICAFDNQTGKVKELFTIPNLNHGPYGIEFIENMLFVSTSLSNNTILSFNLSKLDSVQVITSEKVLFDTTAEDFINQIQRGPDNNLYVSLWKNNKLGIIKKISNEWKFSYTPNLFGKRLCYGGFPNFNASYFNNPPVTFNYTHNCLTDSFSFKVIDTINANQFSWEFKKGNKIIQSNSKNLNILLPDTGNWKIKLIAKSNNKSDSFQGIIYKYPKLSSGYLGKDVFYKKNQNISNSFVTIPQNHCTHWKHETDTAWSITDTFKYNKTGKYISEITTNHFCKYLDTIEVIQCDTLPRPSITRNRDTLILLNNFNYYKAQWKKKYININAPQTAKYTLADTGLYYCVVSTAQGCADSSAGMSVDFLYATTKTNIINRNFQIYPNPNAGLFAISSTSTPINSIEIYNVIGQLVYSKNGINNNSLVINLGNKKGIYFLKINSVMCRKIIVE